LKRSGWGFKPIPNTAQAPGGKGNSYPSPASGRKRILGMEDFSKFSLCPSFGSSQECKPKADFRPGKLTEKMGGKDDKYTLIL
jgi:hypothetical protein